jgi:Sulfotransferase family
MNRVLVVGVPRSGTTWVGRVLAAALETKLLNEPDNHFVAPYAFRAKRQLAQGSYPRLRIGDEAPQYESLWRYAFALKTRTASSTSSRARRRLSRDLLQREQPDHVNRTLTRKQRPHAGLRAAEWLAVPEQPQRQTDTVVVKSVYAALSVEWVTALCNPRVVIVLRNPLNVLSSWLDLNWLRDDALETLARPMTEELAARYKAPLPSEDWSRIERAAWLSGALTSVLADLGDEPGARTVVTHERLCRDRRQGFRAVVDGFGLDWNPQADRLLTELNQPGRGYEVTRVAEQLEDVWRSRLSPEQVSEAHSVLEHFPAYERVTRVRVSP